MTSINDKSELGSPPISGSVQLIGLPRGYGALPDGIYRRVEGQDGPDWVWLCSPIRVIALPRDASGKGWGRLVEIVDPDSRRHRWAIPAEMFAGDGAELRRECLRLGLRLSTAKGARPAFSDLLQRWEPPARALTATRLGWADESCEAFVLGDGSVIGAEDVVYQSEHAPGAAAEMRAAGSLEEWRETVAAPCRGNPLLILALSLAFAEPLLEPLTREGGGVHLRGASSQGKSTAQRVAVSVWGSPGFLHTWRATANGLEGVASAANATLLALDEMGEVAGREVSEAAYMLANGKGKARADRSGAARPSARWRTMILSSGEIRLADKMAEAGKRNHAGQEVRLLDIGADGQAHGAFDDLHGAAGGAAFADSLNRAAATNFGTAGPAFVRALLDDFDAALARAREHIAAFEAEAARHVTLSEGQTLRARERFALIAAAGALASEFGITGWEPGAAQQAAVTGLRLWLDGRGGSGPTEARQAIERTRAFLVKHGEARFERISDDPDQRHRGPSNRAGWRDGAHFYIAEDAWTELHRGADAKRAAGHLRDAGLLVPEGPRRLKRKVPRAAGVNIRAYCVKVEIMGADDD